MPVNESIGMALVKAASRNRGRAWTLGALIVCFGVGVIAACGSSSDNGTEVSTDDAGADRAPIIQPPATHIPIAIAAGGGQACAVMDDGRLFCWGPNEFGQLGNPQATLLPDGGYDFDKRPVPSPQLAAVGNVVQVRSGGPSDEDGVHVANTCAILADAQAQCWGENKYEGLGRPKKTTYEDYGPHPDPLPVMALGPTQQIVTNGMTTCAVSGGRARCWGRTQYWADGGGGASPTEVPIQENLDAKQIALGLLHGVALVENGSVYGWGNNGRGQLGAHQGYVEGLRGAVEIAAGAFTTCARVLSGDVLCMGDNTSGILGRGPLDASQSDLPTRVELPTKEAAASQISMGSDHACALLHGGSVWCWGNNFSGGLGFGTSNGASVEPRFSDIPVKVDGLPGPALAVAAGSGFTCALLEDHTVMCWGGNWDGSLGQGTMEKSPHITPQKVLL